MGDRDDQQACQHCGRLGARRRRQLTRYMDDERNYATLCDECHKEASEDWQERWEDYWANVMGV